MQAYCIHDILPNGCYQHPEAPSDMNNTEKPFLPVMLLCSLLLVSCNSSFSSGTIIAAPDKVCVTALEYAYQYLHHGTEYLWGGQDPLPRLLKVDCSGLVIRCYEYAAQDYGYSLLFNDTTSAGLTHYTVPLSQNELKPGDLIFMGDDHIVSHVALFIQFRDSDIVFIDSTYKPAANINGVSERSYPSDDPRFISYGRMLVRKND